jgi:hypothetical protein
MFQNEFLDEFSTPPPHTSPNIMQKFNLPAGNCENCMGMNVLATLLTVAGNFN